MRFFYGELKAGLIKGWAYNQSNQVLMAWHDWFDCLDTALVAAWNPNRGAHNTIGLFGDGLTADKRAND